VWYEMTSQLTRTRTCHACDGPLPQVTSPWFIKDLRVLDLSRIRSYPGLKLIDSFIHWFIFWTVPMEKYCSLSAKNLKIFTSIHLIQVHHISKIYVCIYLSSITIKEIVVRMCHMFSNIHHSSRKSPKIMKKFVKVAEKNTNNHKYRLFLVLALDQ